MKIPYIGRFRISQAYKGDDHDGLDLVGVDSKRIYSTVSGKVSRAGWENPNNQRQGFGRYVRIDCVVDGVPCCAYFGHLSSIAVEIGDTVQAGQYIGVEGNTGRSTGSHCHYCIRRGGKRGQHIDLPEFAGVPNKTGTYSNPYIVEPPKATKTTAHKVQCGDVLGRIAKSYGVKVAEIVEANLGKYPRITADYIQVGWVLTIPKK